MTLFPIGPYSREALPPDTYHHLDEYGMARLDWNHKPGDSLGGMMRMYFVYNDPKLVTSSASMWYFDSSGKYVGQRHPILPPEDHPMSRDHYTTTLLTLKLNHMRTGNESSMAKIKEITDNTGYIISKMARRTFGLHWWSKAIQGKKFYQFLYHWFEIISAVFIYLPIYAILNPIGNYGKEVDQEDWVPWPDGERLQDLPKYRQTISKILYPSYSMLLSGWQLYVLDDFPLLRKIQQSVYRPMIGKTNYVQQMLFGKKDIPRDKVESYKAMRGGRWSGWLNSRNDRNMRVFEPPVQVNNVDVDILRMLYNETQL
jgi:hypothetical protein